MSETRLDRYRQLEVLYRALLPTTRRTMMVCMCVGIDPCIYNKINYNYCWPSLVLFTCVTDLPQ